VDIVLIEADSKADPDDDDDFHLAKNEPEQTASATATREPNPANETSTGPADKQNGPAQPEVLNSAANQEAADAWIAEDT
jgi:hypothetical protein